MYPSGRMRGHSGNRNELPPPTKKLEGKARWLAQALSSRCRPAIALPSQAGLPINGPGWSSPIGPQEKRVCVVDAISEKQVKRGRGDRESLVGPILVPASLLSYEKTWRRGLMLPCSFPT